MIKKKQINLFSYFFLPSVGGAQVCAHSMAIAYNELGYEVNLITSKDCFLFLKDKKLPYNVISIGNLPLTLIKKYIIFKNIFSLTLYLKLRSTIKNESINIIFGLWPFGYLISKLFTKKLRFLIRPTGDDIQNDKSVNYGLAKDSDLSKILPKIIKNNKFYLAISETVKKEFSKEKKVIISNPGIHSSYFNQNNNYNIEEKYQKEDRIIISIGRNHPKKCFDHLVLLAGILPENFKFIIIGKNTNKIKDTIIDKKVLNRFNFVNELVPNFKEGDYLFPSKRLIKYLCSSHYFVYPTKTETYANVALEAMACFIPCILSNVPGNHDTINDKNGLLFNFGDIKEMKEKILFLENNPSERLKIILNGKKFSEENDWKIKCDEIVKLCNDSILS